MRTPVCSINLSTCSTKKCHWWAFCSATVGLAALYSLGDSYLVMSIAVGVAIMAMQFLRVVHPPAGANPMVIILAGKSAVGVAFLFTPVLVGSVMLVAIAIAIAIASLVNNVNVKEGWPVYWHGINKTRG